MTQEEKQLLLKDLCARLPYGIKVRLEGKPRIVFGVQETLIIVRARNEKGGWEWDEYDIEKWNIKPYLRPMSSMTEEEKQEMSDGSSIAFEPAMNGISGYCPETMAWSVYNVDYCISHHLDYRGLIPMGLALEAPKGMYKTEGYDKVINSKEKDN